ncbi:enoyl-CoA delta isomerase 2-like [Spea bombifrons]|uniref:enoyl-CoA delta isomerase 2-like n=1 Tax=Spea bombifrons TaxID=233779 RepID=UPI00234B917E|nr:enoyl-CoA delta isomerase 2-like [Spea bombifrons]
MRKSTSFGKWNSMGHLSEKINAQGGPLLAEEHITAVPRSSQLNYETLKVTTQDNITTITMNRPKKKNALSLQMYKEIALALDEAARNDCVLTVLTGFGDYFSSGNDLTNSLKRVFETTEEKINTSFNPFRDLVSKVIDFPKPLIAVVNGPAVGVSVTILGLFDLVYATDRATFQTPFSKLALCPEACSSYTFPKIMGLAKATEVLVFNKILTAHDACNLGLVTEVFPDSSFQKEVWTKIKDYAKLPKNALAYSKQLIRNVEKEKLHAVCEKELELLHKIATSDEAINAVMQFFNKSKL